MALRWGAIFVGMYEWISIYSTVQPRGVRRASSVMLSSDVFAPRAEKADCFGFAKRIASAAIASSVPIVAAVTATNAATITSVAPDKTRANMSRIARAAGATPDISSLKGLADEVFVIFIAPRVIQYWGQILVRQLVL